MDNQLEPDVSPVDYMRSLLAATSSITPATTAWAPGGSLLATFEDGELRFRGLQNAGSKIAPTFSGADEKYESPLDGGLSSSPLLEWME